MLYLDSSVLVKRYLHEVGSDRANVEFLQDASLATSYLSHAEILAAISRKCRSEEITRAAAERSTEQFLRDWHGAFHRIELNPVTLAAVPRLVAVYPLKGSDAVHLSAAIWLRDTSEAAAATHGFRVRFASADRQQLEAARRSGFAVFNPEVT